MNSIPSQPLEPESRPLAESEILVDIITETPDDYVPDAHLLQAWASTAMESDRQPLAIKLVSVEDMTALNLQFAGKKKPTNVLSFPAEIWADTVLDTLDIAGQLDFEPIDPDSIDEPFDSAAFVQSLGDIAICSNVVAREAEEQNKVLDAHWAHMVVHGVLHLRGFDHVEEADATLMEAREIDLLQTLGFPNPYLPRSNAGDETNIHS